MTIAEAARRSGLNRQTIRYYEKAGIIPPAKRCANGYRDYSEQHLAMLGFIKRARALGFSLEDSRSLLQLSLNPDSTRAQVKARAAQHLEQIDQQLRQLHEIRDVLKQVVERCAGDQQSGQCPILEQLRGNNCS